MIINDLSDSQISDNYYFVFILGMLAWYISVLPAILVEKRDNKQYVDWHSMITILPYIYGLVNVVIFYLFNTLFPSYANYYIVGVVMGLFYSGLGRVSGHADIYRIGNPHLLHIYGILLYLVLYGVVFNWLDANVSF